MFSKERVIEVFSKEGEIVENLPKTRHHQFKAWVNIMFGCDDFVYCIFLIKKRKIQDKR